MKKVVSIVFVITLVLSLVSCKAAPAPTTVPSKGAVEQTKAPPATPTPLPAKAVRLSMVGSTPASSHYAYQVAAAKVINDYVPGFNVTVVESGGTVDNIQRVSNREADIGSIITVDQVYLAYYGLDKFKGDAKPDIRYIWSYVLTPFLWVVRADSGIKTIADLAGKKYNPGIRGSATEATSDSIIEALALKIDAYRGSTDDALTSVKDNRIVGYTKAGTLKALDASTMDLATFTPIRVLSFTDEEVKKVTTAKPWISFVKIPAGTYPGQAEIQTAAPIGGCIVHKEIATDIAYQIVKAYCEHSNEVRAAFPGLIEDIPKNSIKPLADLSQPVFLHAGAVKYFKELGLDVPAKLIPPEYK